MVDKTLLIDSKSYPDQNVNDLTIYLDEEIDNVHGIRIIFVGIPCTFHNISYDLGNNNLIVYDTTSWQYLRIPDGLYNISSFDKQVGVQLKKLGLHPRAFKFDIDETTGKMVISFRIQKGKTYKLGIRDFNKNLFGFNLLPNRSITLPRGNEEISIGDKPVNFKPFEFYHIHCDLVDTNHMLYNGKKSDLLARIPVKECNFGEINTYYLTGLRDRKCERRFNKLRLWITDEHDKPINFNEGNIQYELLFRRNGEIS